MTHALNLLPSVEDMLYPRVLSRTYLQSLERPQQQQGTGSGAAVAKEAPAGPDQASVEPETSERELAYQAAELQRSEMLKQQVRTCAADWATAHFGIVMPSGALMRFDARGDLKIRTALGAPANAQGGTVSVPELKSLQAPAVTQRQPAKARVAGALAEDGGTINVVSVEIKGPPRASPPVLRSGEFH
jgi:hypothetical protein